MMKKLVTLILAFLLCVPMALPQTVLADEPVAEQEALDSYFRQPLFELSEAKKLLIPESMKEVVFSTNKQKDGILLTGKVKDLTSGKIALKEELSFDRNPVGRISVDGLSDRGVTVVVHVFLDEEEEPAASITLKRQTGKKEWANAGDLTADIYGRKLTGSHKVSFSLEISGKDAKKNTTVLLRSLEFSESSLPVMYFNIDESQGSIAGMNGSADHSVECYGSVSIQVPEGYQCEYTDEKITGYNDLKLDYIRGRGNSTWTEVKKPYKVKLDKKADLFGMGANKHWILLANRFDNSFVRNRMTYWLGARLGLDYTPQCVPVDVVMNGEYYGSYLLCEQIRIGESRVEIDDLEEDEESIKRTDEPFISGGYLLSMDSYGDDNPKNVIETSRGLKLFIESPSYETYNNEDQKSYIQKYVQATEDAINGTNFADAGGKHYSEYLDLDAAANYWWVQEFSANGDAYGSGSTYLYKKRSGKLFWGPLWDFDYVAWGDLDYEGDAPEGFDNTHMAWFDKMRSDSTFRNKLLERWKVMNGLLEEITKKNGLLDSYYEELKISAAYDREKYGPYGENWFGEEEETEESEAIEPVTYEGEIEQLRNWINVRRNWVNGNLNELSPRSYTVRFKANGKVIATKNYEEGTLLTPPAAPKKKGYVFRGWYSKNTGFVDTSTEVYSNMTLKAKYIRKSSEIPAEELYFSRYDVYAARSTWADEESNVYNPIYIVMPYNATNQTVTWSSARPAVATVDENGTVYLKRNGTVKITGTLSSGKKVSYKLHIFNPDTTELNTPSEISLNKNALHLLNGDYTQLRVKLGPKPCFDTELAWISLNPEVAEVDDFGIVQARAAGTADIVVYSQESSTYATCKVTVTATNKKAQKAKTKRVTGVKAKAKNDGTIRVSWKAVPEGAGCMIYMKTGKNGTYKKAGIVRNGKTTFWTSGKLQKGKTYYFRLRPLAKVGHVSVKGKWSSEVSCEIAKIVVCRK